MGLHLQPTLERLEKKAKQVEDEQALGGMRNPHLSVSRIPRARTVGKLVRALLSKAVELGPCLLNSGRAVLTGQPIPELDSVVMEHTRAAVLKVLGGETDGSETRTARALTPLQPEILRGGAGPLAIRTPTPSRDGYSMGLHSVLRNRFRAEGSFPLSRTPPKKHLKWTAA